MQSFYFFRGPASGLYSTSLCHSLVLTKRYSACSRSIIYKLQNAFLLTPKQPDYFYRLPPFSSFVIFLSNLATYNNSPASMVNTTTITT